MSYRILFAIHAILSALLGLIFLILPGRALHLFGVDEYAATRLVSQFFGTAMLAIGLVLWFVKDINEAKLHKGMGVVLLVSAAAGLVISMIGISQGILRSNGWMLAIVYGLFGLGYGYLVFMKPKSAAF